MLRRAPIAVSGVLCAVLALASCEGRGPTAGAASSKAHAAREWPPGCVLAVDDVPIFEEQVDRASAVIAMIEPQSTPPHLRRLALTNVVLPRVLAGLVAPEARAEALAAAEQRLAALRAGTYAGVPDSEGILGTKYEGTWQSFGIPTWGAAFELPTGEWSEVIEDTGSFAVIRVVAREAAPVSAATWFRVDLMPFPYLPDQGGAELLERAYDEHTLTIVDEAWRELVPELTQYRMGVHAD